MAIHGMFPCILLLLLSVSCQSASWVTHKPLDRVSLEAPAGWKVMADATSGRVTVNGPARQQVIVWPVFVAGGMDARMAAAAIRSLAGSAGLTGSWRSAPSPAPNVARAAATSGDLSSVASFAWFSGPGGTAAFLYVTCAPTGAYPAEAETMARILGSFKAAGRPTDSSAPRQVATQYRRWADPRENAFSLDVPQGWAAEGGTFRFAPVDVRKALRAASPDGAIQIAGGDAELPVFTEPTQMLAMTGFPEGAWYSPGYGVRMMVRRYTPGAQFAREYVASRAAAGCNALNFRVMRERPDLDEPLNRLMSGLAAVGGFMRMQSGEVFFQCERNGQPLAGYWFAGVLRTASAGMPGGIWRAEYLYGYLAAQDREPQAQQILSHMLASYQDDPQWLAMQQNVTAATSRIVAQTHEEISRRIASSFKSRNQVDDEISRRRSNAILGVVDAVDAETGRQFKVENSSNYYWLDPQGRIVGTQTDTTPGWDFRQLATLP